MEGTWHDQFEEIALNPLMFYPHESVIEMVENVNVDVPLSNSSLKSYRERLEQLFKDKSVDYAEKYRTLESCVEMIRMSKKADPLRSIKEKIHWGDSQ